MEDRIWCVPLSAERVLVYAPFHGLTTLVNRASAELLGRWLRDKNTPTGSGSEWILKLAGPGDEPARKEGPPDPLYLGLIPTTGCMLRCAYCDFPAESASPVMSFGMIRQAVDGYAALLRDRGASEWQMHFFGGEPFAAYKETVFALNYARQRAAELGLPAHFEVTTNGYYSEAKAAWIADNFDTVVLSMDGFPDVQNRHRPAPGGRRSFETVCRSADIFARGNCELIIRSCVSGENTEDMAEWAALIAERFFPAAVVLEPMIESRLARRNGLLPPDPDRFIRHWTEAFRFLRAEKIPLICSSGEIGSLKTSLCPMGRDAVIAAPDGTLGGCWRIAETRMAEGVDLEFGEITGTGLNIDTKALERQRELSGANRADCRKCFCYAHCAGGCLLSRNDRAGFCRMTRALTLWQLLERLGYASLGDDLLSSAAFIDRLADETDFTVFGQIPCDWPEICVEERSKETDSFRKMNVRRIDLPGIPSDQDHGWVRDGEVYRIADIRNGKVMTLEGTDALRFQLEHAGMSPSEAEKVFSALTGGAA